jgi:penicillin amidase
MPRVYARDKISAFYALGFAEAQDRLWSMHVRKMIVQGRLS